MIREDGVINAQFTGRKRPDDITDTLFAIELHGHRY